MFFIVFVFVSEFFVFEMVEDFCDGFCWFGKYRFERNVCVNKDDE